MNKVHRTIWNAARGCFVVAHEKASANGKPSSARKGIAQAVAAAVLAMGAGQALATCGSTAYTITTAITSPISLCNGDSLTVDATGTNTGSIIVGSGNAVILSSISTSGGIANQGTIAGGNNGINVNFSTLSGGIINGGTITGGNAGISVGGNSTVSGGITNYGLISGHNYGILVNSGATISDGITSMGTINDGITNRGTINSANSNGIYLNNGTVSGGITNQGAIAGVNNGIYMGSLSTLSGGITNSGTINGAHSYGIYLGNGTVSGGINNSVTGSVISGGNTGIDVNHSTLSGGIVNAGTISGAHKVGILVAGSTISGGITNSGLISGSQQSLSVDGTSTISGDIHNQSTGQLVGGLSLGNGTNLYNSGTITLESGVVDPGSLTSIQNTGTITSGTVSGNYIQDSSGILRIAATGTATGQYGQLVVTGNASIAGTIDVDVKAGNTLVKGDSLLNVVTATGSISGTFAHVTDNSLLFDFQAVYPNVHEVDLTAIAATNHGVYNAVVATGNLPGIGAATVLDDLIVTDPNGTLAHLFQGLPDQRTVSNAVSQTLPLLTASANDALSDSLHVTNRIIQARQESNHGQSSGDEFIGNKAFWFKPFGSWASQGDRNGTSGFSADTYGMIFGADGEVNESNRVGIAIAYSHSNIDSNSAIAPNSANVNNYQLIGYGSHSVDERTEISYQFDVGQHTTKGSRDITFAGSVASSNYDGWSAHAGVGLGRIFSLDNKTTFTPSVRADYTWMRDESYAESGAGALNLNVNSNTAHELILAVDGKITRKLTDGISFTANLGGGYDTLGRQSSITSAYAGAPTAAFITRGLDPSRWLARGGLGLVNTTQGGIEVSARYDFEVRESFNNQTASLKVRVPF